MTAEAKAWVEDPSEDPMFGVALLKIAMQLKKDPAAGAEAVIAGVVAAMGFPEDAFRRYVQKNLGLLVTTARKRGY
jgi:hypothetical protein